MQKIPEIPRFTTFQALKFTHSIPRRPHIRDAIRRGLGGKEYALPFLRCAIGAHPCPKPSAFENAHRTVLREVLYRGRRVCIHGTVDKAGYVVFRCTLEGSQADRWLEVPAWMFDRTAYPDPGLLAAQPHVSIEALAALSALLDLALKDQTPSAVLLSGASGASHDQNRGEIRVTRDDKLRERVPTQSTTAPAASDRYQVLHNRESSALQYAMRDRLTALGWSEVELIDDDLGRSAAGGVQRAGFERMVAEVCLGKVGAVCARMR